MSKSTILMLPTWYPTKNNPINGVFFREQAIAMQKDFNFLVVTYHESAERYFLWWFRKLFGLPPPSIKIIFVQNDYGLQEYAIYTNCPQVSLWDLFIKYFKRFVLHKHILNG